MGALVPLFTALLASAPAACPSAVLLLRVATFSFVASSAKAAVSRSEGRQTLSRFGRSARASPHHEMVAVLRSHVVVKPVRQRLERPQTPRTLRLASSVCCCRRRCASFAHASRLLLSTQTRLRRTTASIVCQGHGVPPVSRPRLS